MGEREIAMYSYTHYEFDDIDGNRGIQQVSYRIEECDKDSIIEQIKIAEDEAAEKLELVTVTLIDSTTEESVDLTVFTKDYR